MKVNLLTSCTWRALNFFSSLFQKYPQQCFFPTFFLQKPFNDLLEPQTGVRWNRKISGEKKNKSDCRAVSQIIVPPRIAFPNLQLSQSSCNESLRPVPAVILCMAISETITGLWIECNANVKVLFPARTQTHVVHDEKLFLCYRFANFYPMAELSSPRSHFQAKFIVQSLYLMKTTLPR